VPEAVKPEALPDLAPLRERLLRAGSDTEVDRPPERPGFNRVHFRDTFGTGSSSWRAPSE